MGPWVGKANQEKQIKKTIKQKKTIIFVTHNLSEAVYLGGRIVVFLPNPGRIREVVPVDFPRPRDDLSSEFIALQRHVNDLIRDK